MKHLLTLLATLCILAAPAAAQTIKSLGYNTTNAQIVAATNVVWTNSFSFSTNTVAAQVRTNLGLGATNDVIFDDVQATGFLVGDATNSQIAFEGNSAATTRTNLGLGLPLLTNTSITNFQAALFSTNTAPTNTTNVSAWTTIQIGTNAFRVPLYQ